MFRNTRSTRLSRHAVLGLAALSLGIPLLASGPASTVTANRSVDAAAAADVPDPAAPVGGCAVTQAPEATRFGKATDVATKKVRTVRAKTSVRRLPDGRWRARVTSTKVWKASATVAVTDRYASADCDVAERAVTGSARRSSKVRVDAHTLKSATTRKAAVRKARKAATVQARRSVRSSTVTKARDAAFLKARLSFLATLPTRPTGPTADVVRTLTGKQVCPKRLASGTDNAAASRPGATVPQFAEPAAVWVCTYSFFDGKVVDRTEATGSRRRALVNGLRSLRYSSDEEQDNRACTADLGPLKLVAHVAIDGTVTGTVVQDFGCHDVALTADPARVIAGTRTTPGVPAGIFHGRPTFYGAVAGPR